MPAPTPRFSAVSSSARQLLMLLQCIAFAKRAQVRISTEGLRFSTEEGAVMEAFVFLEKSLFSTYNYYAPSSSQEDRDQPPIFEISLNSLLEALKIFSLSDPTMSKRPGDIDSFAAHRLNRHSGIDAFSSRALGMGGICTFTYEGEGSPLSINMSEGGVTTTCDLTTYEAETNEEIPFNRDALAMKTIIRSSYLLDALHELSAMNPTHISIHATPSQSRNAGLSLATSGSMGSATIDWNAESNAENPVLETFVCPQKTVAMFNFSTLKAAQRAMATSTKVSLRLDAEGVLSMQFLIEVDPGDSSTESVTFVDFRAVPLVEGEAEVDDSQEEDDDSE